MISDVTKSSSEKMLGCKEAWQNSGSNIKWLLYTIFPSTFNTKDGKQWSWRMMFFPYLELHA